MRPGELALAMTIATAAPSVADVRFAAPDDPVVRALYARADPRTGLTPAAEPDVAAGREAPRTAREGCLPGFRVAELQTREWAPPGGPSYRLATFLVTPDSPPDRPLPCYHPEPWVCALEQGDAGAPRPLDCVKVERIVFPGQVALDTAPFDLSESERAFGVRLRNETAHRWGTEVSAALGLFRLHDRRVLPVLSVPVLEELDDFGQGAACKREVVVRVERSRTLGFFDWTVRTATNRGPGTCTIEPDPVGTYRWNGRRYVR